MNRSPTIAVLLFGVSVGCATERTQAGPPAATAGAPGVRGQAPGEYPGTLRPPAKLGADFQWRQQVTARWPDGERSFEAVLTKQQDELVLVGLGPMNSPGFVITVGPQAELRFENHTQQAVRFDPRYVLLDVQRVFYPWFDAPLQDGQRHVTADGELVTEQWTAGVLVRRTFSRLDHHPAGEIVVTYADWQPGQRAPRVATLSNGWFGYSLVIETVSQEAM